MKFKKISLLLGIVLGMSALSLLTPPAQAFWFDSITYATLQYPSTHAIGYWWDYYYKHRVEMWGVLDGQGHYLKITFEWQAWVRGHVWYYRRDWSMRFATGQSYTWYDMWYANPDPSPYGGFFDRKIYDYSYSAPQYRPIYLSVWSFVTFATIQR